MANDSKLLIGLILGAAAGAIAGLLLAPASGDETREKIKGSIGGLKDDFDAKLNEVSKKIKDLDDTSLEGYKNKFERIKNDAKKKYANMSEKLKDLEQEIGIKMDEIKKKPLDKDSKNV